MKEFKKNKIKICHFVNRVTGKEDGVFRHLCAQIKFLDNSLYEQFVISQGDFFVENIFRELNIKYYSLPLLNKKYSIRIFFHVAKIISLENADIINAHSLKPYIIAGLMNFFLRRKIIFSYHGSFIENDYNTKLDKFIYKILHHIICRINNVNALVPSRRNKNILISETKLFSRIDFYYNGYLPIYFSEGIDANLFSELHQLKEKYFVIGYTGRLNREKNVKCAIKILYELKNHNVFLVIFGDGEERVMLENYALSLSIGNIKFYGFVHDAVHYMKLFDLLILTSKTEGLPIVIWEAMFNKIPVISTDAGGVKEIIEENNCGFIFSCKNYQEAVSKIILLMNDKTLCKKLGENGYQAIVKKYNLNNFKIFFEKYYYNLVNEGRN
ncbi:glycosyltransferase [Ignavibacteria bacterium 4148-Me]|uniref:glycosyltransferase n=1 Tax=Rosettibacter primus TaxID=3111523 RepID=UPI00336BFC93